ncbi:DUF4400 domain-containing protein [Thiomicrorhabdus indica]|uniref:DUF4400 domain-containing protein n=1 Tax=Thiomicrorhabdus indica TaxID=2267253 RepID=UPI00102D8430|nr:DUF4400 domain-containing protein [Thiomicrorhabdus indica]
MAETSGNKGVVVNVTRFILLAIVSYFISLFFSILIEWVGIYFQWWSLSGSQHAYNVLKVEFGWLHSDYQSFMVTPGDLSLLFIQYLDTWVVKTTWFSWFVEFLGQSSVLDYLYAMIYVIQTALLRLSVIIMSIPALMLFVLFALIDGLAERDIRTWSGGRETSFVYHHAKSYIVPFMVLPIILYLSIPISIHPSIFMLLFVLPASMTVWVVAKYFKKYL